MLHTSGRVLSGGITVVFGSITMVYDIYKLSTEMEAIVTKKAGDELREIANQLEIALDSFLSGCNDDPTSIHSTFDTINHNDKTTSQTLENSENVNSAAQQENARSKSQESLIQNNNCNLPECNSISS